MRREVCGNSDAVGILSQSYVGEKAAARVERTLRYSVRDPPEERAVTHRQERASAFDGLPRTPTFSDFFYYAVSTAFVSPPGDIVATSKGARTATMIELLTGTAALAAYLGSFIDFGMGAAEAAEDAPAPTTDS